MKKRIILITILVLFVISILISCMVKNINSRKPLLNLREVIENESINDMRLTIYYMSSHILTMMPMNIEALISNSKERFVIDGNDLAEHIDLFKQINNEYLIPVKKKTRLMDIRVYYVLESEKNGKLFEVAMWGGNDDENSVYVNGFEVIENVIFYDVIMPFLSEDAAEELESIKQRCIE